jgi:large subunit ribosomal protein L6
MSRIAKNPVDLSKDVKVVLLADQITVVGPLGSLSQTLTGDVEIKHDNDQLTCVAANESRHAKAMSGTLRALVANMVTGVTKGFERKLVLVGVGYRAQVQSNVIKLQLGFSHDVLCQLRDGIKAECPTPTEIVIRGMDKQRVGQQAAEIRAYRKRDPYKGKGVWYAGERVVTKTAKKK